MVDRIRHQRKIAAALAAAFCLFASGPIIAAAQEVPFKPGESLLFNARWLWFDAGMVETSVSATLDNSCTACLRLTMHTWTTHTIAKLFTMDDRFETVWDTRTRLPLSMQAAIRESTTNKDKRLEFNHAEGVARVIINEKEPETFPLDPNGQDFFGASFWIRSTRLAPKQKLQVPVFEDNKNYHAQITVLKRERIRVLDGEIDTLLLLARLKFEGAFSRSDLLYVWLTDDEWQIPVRMRMQLTFGDVVLDLVRAEGVPLRLIRPEPKGNGMVRK